MNDKLTSYPAHDLLNERLRECWLAEDAHLSHQQLKAVSEEFSKLQYSQQRQEAMIRELVEVLKEVQDAVDNTLAGGVIYVGLEDSPAIIKAAINRANQLLQGDE